ncbi:MAG: type II and III secretion system protein [Gallionellales bacterium RIFCSPLOWO2_12_FULL_59_22]|nr:MAG: type II and III secretion system protein [Gallionellales bacterium RIFCSPLOWO2_02_FULL_59_110]OGT04948.1 MAG: type II and III secretion system protein [Gallionellales bacterium RIFCSPLOWO2_02_58_13]OGT12686.1 MAG: type II and III secretion system protein [Gallionellales bacterium RIFCSPLOWO2_12_FULL_59_22]
MRLRNIFYLCAASVILAGCGAKPIQPSDKHIQRQADQPAPTTIPQPIRHSVTLPPPKPAIKAETYSVVVTNVPAQEILFALARDAKINLDIHPGIQGTVTLNALDQTLPQILTRIARQIDMRYELDNGNLTVMPDTPYLHSYKIDYVNMTREAEGGISNTTQVGSTATGGTGAPSGSTAGANNSQLAIKNSSKNHFWGTLIQNIKDILRETDKILPEGSSETVVQQASTASSTGTGARAAEKKPAARNTIADSPNPVSVEEGGMTVTRRSTFREAASVIANPENGIITVRATGKQHEKIQEFIGQIMASARRQVLIEATVVEVSLNDNYKQGINWSALRLGTRGVSLNQLGTADLPSVNPFNIFTLDYANPTSNGNFSAQISLLESFGTVKVLSSPKLSVMNNQTAVLRVVDNLVYFNITVTPGTINSVTGALATPPTYSSTPQTVPVGFTMSVTPQISESDSVQINLRPTVTRLVKYVNDPNPDLAAANVRNPVPETQTREIESVLKIGNNQIAVMGGLMQDEINNLTDAVPGLASIPGAGNLFKNRNDNTQKTELVIFLRPVVIKDASIDGDFSAYRDMLPDRDFFKEPVAGKP